MTTRYVKGQVKWARELSARPKVIPQGRARGIKALGVRYEKALAKALGTSATHGAWFEYEDSEGRWFCQVDFLLPSPKGLVVGEAKLTWTMAGHKQIEGLYSPVLKVAGLAPTGGIVICKSILPETRREAFRITSDLSHAMALAEGSRRVVLQWLPKTPLGGGVSTQVKLASWSTEFGLDLGLRPC